MNKIVNSINNKSVLKRSNIQTSITTTLVAVVALLVVNSMEQRAGNVYNIFFILMISPIFFIGFWLWGYALKTLFEKTKTVKNVVSYTLFTLLAILIMLVLIYSFSTDTNIDESTDGTFPYLQLLCIIISVSLCYGISKWYFDKIKKD